MMADTTNQYEQSLIGGLLIDNDKWDDVKDILKESDFFITENRNIFKAISKKLSKGSPADVLTLSDDNSFNLADLAILAKDTPCSDNVIHYAEQVKKRSENRKAIYLLKKSIADIENGKKDAFDIAEQLSNSLALDRLAKSKFNFVSLADFKVKQIDWLIHDFIESDSLIELFGEPESGKSLLAIHWAFCVASGVDWCGHSTNKGTVFYIAGEGHNGLARRYLAATKELGLSFDELPFHTSERAASFCSKESAKDVEMAISEMVDKTGEQPRLIVIDTLARNFGGGNENSTEDMNSFVSHIDQHLRSRFNATVLLVHHTGHGAKERGRGSSVLKAALDGEFRMHKTEGGSINLSCTKMKDAPHPEPKSFMVKVVDLGIADDQDQPINGVVLNQVDYVPEKKPDSKSLGKNQTILLNTLNELHVEHRDNFIDRGKDPDEAKVTINYWHEKTGLERNRFNEAKNSLIDRRLIVIDNYFVEPTELATEI